MSIPTKTSVLTALSGVLKQAIIDDLNTTAAYSKQKIGMVTDSDVQSLITMFVAKGWSASVVVENQPGTGLNQPQVKYLEVK